MEKTYVEESVFNMALAYLKRIDKLFYFCQQASIKQDIDGWISYLRGVYREASIKMNDEEEEEILGNPKKPINFKLLTDNMIKKEECNFRNIYFLSNNPKNKIKYKKTILFLLDGLEVKIRRLLQKKRMLLPSKDDPRRSITQR